MVCFTKVVISVGCALALSFVFYGQKNLSEHARVEKTTGTLREKPTRISGVRQRTIPEPAKRQETEKLTGTGNIGASSGAYGM